MALGKLIGIRADAGVLGDIDGPTSVASSNGLGQRNPLGFTVLDDLGNEYIYMAGVASVAAGDWCFYVPGTWAVTRLPASTATTGLICVATAAVIASCWGFFQVKGLTPSFTAIATGAADGSILSAASGTIGRVSLGATSTKVIFGAVGVGASASNVGTAAISYPFEFGSATV